MLRCCRCLPATGDKPSDSSDKRVGVLVRKSDLGQPRLDSCLP